MTDKVISIAEWKAQHRPQRRVPVYHVVPDPDGGYRLELAEWLEWDEFDAMINAAASD